MGQFNSSQYFGFDDDLPNLKFSPITQFQEYGYSSKLGPNGNLPSGPEGSGVVVVTFSLMFSYTLIWAYKLFTHEKGKAADIGLEEKDD